VSCPDEPDGCAHQREGKIIVKKLATVLLMAGAATACAQPAFARNNIRVVGSSTVYPFTKAVSERFARANPRLSAPIIESTGTGGGMKLFCAGIGANHPDVANASRRMKASEAKTCAANGVGQVTEIQIGMDGLALATAKNSQITDITLRDLYAALAKTPWGKPNTAKTWKDVNPKLPALPIRVYGPPPTSGTRDSFNELLMEAGCHTNPAMKALAKTDANKHKAICTGLREDGAFIEAGENDNLIVQKLAANPNTMGAFGYSYLEENTASLKGVALNGVEPTNESITSFKYPGARMMYVYVKNAHAKAIPGLRQFVAEYVKETTFGTGGYLQRIGLVPSKPAERAQAAKIATTLSPVSFGMLK
jgi:phosphate transport system substrate-binding protein